MTITVVQKVEAAFGGKLPTLPPFRQAVESDVAEERENALALVVDHLRNGQDVPADVAARIIDAENRQRLAAVRLDLINTAADTIRTDHASASRGRFPAGFAALNEALTDLFAEAATLAEKLTNIRTADAAIASGAANDWKRAGVLADAYGDLRTLQLKYTRIGLESTLGDLGAVTRHLNSVGLFRNALDISPYWSARRHAVYTAATEPDGTNEHSTAFYQWISQGQPSDDGGTSWSRSWWPDNAPRIPFLLWLARNAEPWSPEPDTLTATYEAAQAATTVTRTAATDPNSVNIDGLRRYRELTRA